MRGITLEAYSKEGSKSVKLFVFANKIQGRTMPLDTAQIQTNNGANQHMVCINGMFHKGSVEHKLTAHDTATNVPRECSTALMITHALMI